MSIPIIGQIPGVQWASTVATWAEVIAFLDIMEHFQDPMFKQIIVGQAHATGSILKSHWLMWRINWMFLRMTIPLRHRLLIEQLLWNMGGKYRELITNFNPIDSPDITGPPPEPEETPLVDFPPVTPTVLTPLDTYTLLPSPIEPIRRRTRPAWFK